MDPVVALLVVNAGTLLSILGFGYRIIRFINHIEFKTELMWKDYERRMNNKGEE